MKAFLGDLAKRYPKLDKGLISQLARRHGSIAADILGDADTMDDLGQFIAEILYIKRNRLFQTLGIGA